MESKEDMKALLEDVSWERQNCPRDAGSDLLVNIYMAEKKIGRGATVKLSKRDEKDESIKELVKSKRIKIRREKKGKSASFANDLGRIVAMGEISLRIREQKNLKKD